MKLWEPYKPAPLLRGAFLQTFLASSKIRLLGRNHLDKTSEEMIITAGDGTRLLGLYSRHEGKKSKGLVILLHGWEGSATSTYIQSTGRRFFNSGYSVFRLNMRDHGESHHLNKGMFYSTLLDEVFDAVSFISSMEKEGPVFFVGFSLGGNFGMRIARKCSEKPVDNLKHIVCISPVLDPNKATIKIDDHFLIKKYFLRKWRRSLKKKQALYPDIYDFSDLFPINTIMGLTDLLLKRYSEYSNIQEYFKGYTLINDAVKNISVPTTMIISKDDPIIPIEDFHSLKTNSLTNLLIHEYGGHNGFIEGYLLRSWYERYMVRLFGQYQA
ncbi:MAG: alpha/beta fold hydrolase [Desulfobacterales bacterium]|jgi:uncharacterized protein|nr:alpha/beta fold hydrolase [Desulfobacterales bacterium]MBT7696654.1 alpha/beta fold hydrolase [Desulfobacterales bacterium]